MCLARKTWAVILLASFSFVWAASPEATAGTVSTNFEEFSPNTVVGEPFTIGTTPERATFSGKAFAGQEFIGELYYSGSRAWMVESRGTGIIEFETNASEVTFWARTRSLATRTTEISAFDSMDQQIGSTVVLNAPDPFQLVSFSGNIAWIKVFNKDVTYMNAVDDFTFTTIPEPSTFVLGLLGMAALIGYRRLNQRSRWMRRSVSRGGTLFHVSQPVRNGSHQVRADFPLEKFS